MSALATKKPENENEDPTSGYWAEERPGGGARFRVKIGGLHCSLCTGTIERALGRRDGVDKVAVSLTHEQALVDYDPSRVRPEELVGTLKDIGYTIWDPRKTRPYEEEEAALVKEGRRLSVAIGASLAAIALIVNLANPAAYAIPVLVGAFLLTAAYLVLRGQGQGVAIGGTLAATAVGGAALAANATGAARGATPYVVGVLAVAVVFGLANHILSMAAQSLRRGILNQHVMLEAGALAGLAGGIVGLAARYHGFPTAAFFAVSVLVVNYHVFSEWLSLLVKTRSSQAVKGLLDLQPDVARVIRDGAEVEVPLSEVGLAELVRVRPGERIPLDGTVVDGHSAVDQALVTGEPVPVEAVVGDAVIGGSINSTGTLVVKVSALGDEGFLAQVVRQVEDARALKPGILQLVDRILRVYTPTVLSISVLALLAWLFGSWAVTGTVNVERAVFAALSVLVMGYPCAVGIAAPLSIVRGGGEAADAGILMRTGEAFQSFRSVKTIMLDKTGTLTEGHPALREVLAAGGTTDDEVIALAAAAEAPSEHPLARAIVDAALDRGLSVRTPRTSNPSPAKGSEPASPAAGWWSAGPRCSPPTASTSRLWPSGWRPSKRRGAPWSPSLSTVCSPGRSPLATSCAPTPPRRWPPCAPPACTPCWSLVTTPGPRPRWRPRSASRPSTPGSCPATRPTSSETCSVRGRWPWSATASTTPPL